MQKPAPYGYSTEVARSKLTNDLFRWDVMGWAITPLDDPKEPKRLHSWYDWRGSNKYPFGRVFVEPFFGDHKSGSNWLPALIAILIIFIFWRKTTSIAS